MTEIQATCDRCQAPLTPGASYCDKCGQRTRKARRNVRLAVRIEVLFLVLVVLLIAAFTVAFYLQK